jgi:DNA-directed RNA polymerase subunit RPC12/RpoP
VPLDWEGIKNQVYECVWCHTTFKGEECILIDRLACPNCGCRVFEEGSAASREEGESNIISLIKCPFST